MTTTAAKYMLKYVVWHVWTKIRLDGDGLLEIYFFWMNTCWNMWFHMCGLKFVWRATDSWKYISFECVILEGVHLSCVWWHVYVCGSCFVLGHAFIDKCSWWCVDLGNVCLWIVVDGSLVLTVFGLNCEVRNVFSVVWLLGCGSWGKLCVWCDVNLEFFFVFWG